MSIKMNIRASSVNVTKFEGELSEAELTELICSNVCRQMGVDPRMDGVSFRAYMASDAGGIGPIRRYVKYEVVIDHTKQPTVEAG